MAPAIRPARDFQHRKGSNDKPIEIFHDGQYVESFMSCLRTGDFFLMDGKAFNSKVPVCMVCKTPPMVDTRYSTENPTIVMGVTEIATAPPIVDRQPAIAGPDSKPRLTLSDIRSIGDPKVATGNGQLPRHSSYYDAEDVEFKE